MIILPGRLRISQKDLTNQFEAYNYLGYILTKIRSLLLF